MYKVLKGKFTYKDLKKEIFKIIFLVYAILELFNFKIKY